jgi:hypothetical protein
MEDMTGERGPPGGQERRRDPERQRGSEREREEQGLNGVARRSVEVVRAGQVRFQRRDVSTEFQSKKLRTPPSLRGNSRAPSFFRMEPPARSRTFALFSAVKRRRTSPGSEKRRAAR